MRLDCVRRFFPILGLVMLTATIGQAADSDKLNVVLIICDDLGVGDVGCYYAQDNPTPYLDQLASNCLVHPRFYTTSPSCSPARASLLTGRDAREVGVNSVLMGDNRHALSKAALTLGELFQQSGYKTGYIGKWHLGYGEDHDPRHHGFDYFFGHRGGKIDYFEYTDRTQKYAYDLWENDQPVEAEGYSTRVFADKSMRFIDEHAESPFFLYVSLNAPHWDNQGNVPAPHDYVKTLGADPTKREVYVGALREIDACVRRIVQTLEQQDLLDQTIFIFTSDQGAWKPTGGSNGPLRGFKGKSACFEGGLRIPFIMDWPGLERETQAISKRANLLDVFPTLAVRLNLTDDLEGYEGVDLFAAKERRLFAYHDKKNIVYDLDWKHIRSDNGENYLFDLSKDPRERTNLAATRSDKANELRERIDKRLRLLERQ